MIISTFNRYDGTLEWLLFLIPSILQAIQCFVECLQGFRRCIYCLTIVGILNLKSIPDFLIFSSCLLVQHRTDPRLLALSLYLRRVVRRSVVELSLRIFIKTFSRNFSTENREQFILIYLIGVISVPE